MSSALIFNAAGFAVFVLLYTGLAAICAGYDRHRRQLWPASGKPSASKRAALAVGGWLLLALSLWLAVSAWSGGIGWVLWFALLTAATTLLVVQLAYAPRFIPVAVGAGGCLAFALLISRALV